MRRRIRGPILMALALPILVGSYFAYHRLVHQPTLPEGLIQANGRIERDHITVSSKFSGRIQTMSVQEGDWVKAGQTLIVLDDTQVRTRVTEAEKAVETLQAKLDALRIDLELLRLPSILYRRQLWDPAQGSRSEPALGFRIGDYGTGGIALRAGDVAATRPVSIAEITLQFVRPAFPLHGAL